MIQVAHFLQEGAKSCIPASVRMVLQHLGIEYSELELVKILESGIQGTSIFNIELLPVTDLGLKVWTGEMLPETLKEHLEDEIPVIVVVLTGDLPYREDDNPHTPVVVGCDDKSVYINDAKVQEAPVSVPWENFLTAWEDFGNFAAVIQKEA